MENLFTGCHLVRLQFKPMSVVQLNPCSTFTRLSVRCNRVSHVKVLACVEEDMVYIPTLAVFLENAPSNIKWRGNCS